jgi:hypothetical protein
MNDFIEIFSSNSDGDDQAIDIFEFKSLVLDDLIEFVLGCQNGQIKRTEDEWAELYADFLMAKE